MLKLPGQYKIYNNVLFKLIKQDWKIVLSSEILEKLFTPAYESLSHASPLKCYKVQNRDFTINNMFWKIKGKLLQQLNCKVTKFAYICGDAKYQQKGKQRDSCIKFFRTIPRSSRGVRHILVCIDIFTKALHLYPIVRPTAKAVLKVMLGKYIPCYGKMKKFSVIKASNFKVNLSIKD